MRNESYTGYTYTAIACNCLLPAPQSTLYDVGQCLLNTGNVFRTSHTYHTNPRTVRPVPYEHVRRVHVTYYFNHVYVRGALEINHVYNVPYFFIAESQYIRIVARVEVTRNIVLYCRHETETQTQELKYSSKIFIVGIR